MNRIHRIVFNRKLGVRQVASELAFAHGGNSTEVRDAAPATASASGRARWLVCGMALAGSAAFVSVAWAEPVPTGTPGANGASSFFIGKDGRSGFAAISLSGSTRVNSGDVRTGGAGGSGGNGAIMGGQGGRGGAGVRSDVEGNALDNRGTIVGGRGGNGGNSLTVGGAGGNGGEGVAMTAGGAIDNSGSIIGGAGGNNGAAFVYSVQAGEGGVGITSNGNVHVTNSGSIAGGMGNDGVQADAIRFSGGGNMLELRKGSAISGTVNATENGNDALALGGSGKAAFDVAAIGDDAQYRHFAAFEKVGSGSWTLTGETAALTPWEVRQGTLSISSDANLGDAAGRLTLDGGTLRTTADVASARALTLGENSGEIKTDGGTQLSLAGAVSGAGGLHKTGNGDLVLTGSNSYQGGTVIDAGRVTGHADSFGSGAIADNAALVIDQASDAVMANDLFDAGSFTKTGAGALALTGEVDLHGGAVVNDGRLQVGQASQVFGRSSNQASITGVHGADGSSGFLTGKDGKAGSAGVALVGSATGLDNHGTLTGGQGGNGGSALGLGGDGARGGAGVASSVAGAALSNAGTIGGGQGGAGGSAAIRGEGGAGGTGVEFSAAGTLDNTGSIEGGRGGNRGTIGLGLPGSAAGGVGITTAGGVTVNNAGHISGGLSADGNTRSDAIQFNGGNNRLELQASSVIDGNVVATQAGGDTLALTGKTDGSFDTAQLGAGAQYRNFTGYEKTGSSTWTLTGTTEAVTPWSVTEGTLSISDDGALGDAAGRLTLDGGTLRTTADVASTRAVTLGQNNGEIKTDRGTQLALAGEVSGAGSLYKTGKGDLVLTGSNTYEGGTVIDAGRVTGHAGSFGSGSIADNAALVIDQASDAVMANNLLGAGSFTKTGAGTLALTGDVDLHGGAVVNDGRLQVGQAANTGAPQRMSRPENNEASITGVRGADGSSGFLAGKDGKAGNAGVALVGNATGLDNYGTLTGGQGGNGGNALGLGGDGARGGAGVASSVTGAAVSNAGTIVGGQGGAGGSAAVRGMGGTGGTGVELSAAGTLDNQGSIEGGRGGNRAAIGLGLPGSAAGGVGITTAGGVTVNNAGHISGGLSADGNTRSDAIHFNGGNNRLALQASSVIEGNVVATQAGGDTLALTGKADGSFDAAQIGAGAQYRNFTGYEKTGSATWTLTGTTEALTPWSVKAGTLSISDDASLGDVAGRLALDGGTLRTTADVASQRAVELGGAGGTLSTDEGTTLAVAGTISGAGHLAKEGSGTLVLSADNSFAGGTAISAGTLQLGNGGTSGAITGDVANNGTLAFDRSDALSFAGAISGSGAVEQRGTGTTILTGVNSYTGGTLVSNGVLQGNSDSLQGDIVNNAAVTFDQNVDGIFAGTMSGSGALRKTAAGTLTLAAANSYSGGTAIDGGTLAAGTSGALGSGPVAVNAGGTLRFEGTADAGGLAISIARAAQGFVPTEGGTVQFADASSAGHATLVNKGAVEFKDDASAGNAALTNQAGGVIGFGGHGSADNASIVNEAGALVRIDKLSNAGVAIGSLEGAGDVQLGAKALATGGLDRSSTISGVVSGEGGSLNKIGSGTLTLAGINTYSGGTTVSAGTLVGNAASFGSGPIANNAALVIDQATSATFANAMSGHGDLTKAGIGALNLTGDSAAFSGHTQVAAGSLAVNGALGGTLTVADGATLKGNGTVGDTTVLAGGTVAPGNSIGTLHVNGNLKLAQGAAYQVEASPDGRSDLIHATGTVTLDGTTAVAVAADGNWNPYKTYTIVSADGGVNGAFGGVVSNFAFLDPRVSYDAQNASLSLMRNDVSFRAVGITPNQKASGSAIERLPASDLYRAVVQLDAPTAISAFDQLSGELHASVRTSLMEDSRFVRDASLDRLRQAQGGVASAADMTLSESADGAAWGRAYGSWGDTHNDGNAASVDRSTSGVLLGADRRVSDWRVGVIGGASQSKVDVDARNSSASIDSYHLGAYAGTQWQNLALRTGVDFSQHDLDTHRAVAFTGLADALDANYHAQTTQAFGELGWRMDVGNGAALEPFGNLAYANLHTNDFAERGGIAALSAPGSTTETTFTTLGLRASWGFDIGGVQAAARGLVGWRHAFGDVAQTATLAFAGGSAFGVGGVPIAQNALVLDAGVDFSVRKDLTLTVGYGGQVGDGATDQAIKASLLWKF